MVRVHLTDHQINRGLTWNLVGTAELLVGERKGFIQLTCEVAGRAVVVRVVRTTELTYLSDHGFSNTRCTRVDFLQHGRERENVNDIVRIIGKLRIEQSFNITNLLEDALIGDVVSLG